MKYFKPIPKTAEELKKAYRKSDSGTNFADWTIALIENDWRPTGVVALGQYGVKYVYWSK